MSMDSWWRDQGELDSEQLKIIELPDEGSFLVKGPPGSGKTNLLLLRANYLSTVHHPNLVILTFNKTLRNFIRSGAGRYDFDSGRVKTSAQLIDELLREAGEEYEKTGDFKEDRQARLDAAERVFLSTSRQPIFDIIFIDEAQDFLPGEIRLFRALASDLFMVADARQRIYSAESPISTLESVVDECHSLIFHYRSGPPICEVADQIGNTFSEGYDAILPSCNYNSSRLQPSVDVFQGDLNAQGTEIARRLHLQEATYSDSLLGVICPKISDVRLVANILRHNGLGEMLCIQDRDDQYNELTDDRRIWLSTVHGAKGLEFRTLHFASAETVVSHGAGQKRLAYTGVTRAKTALSIYHKATLPGYFDAAVQKFRPKLLSRPGPGVAFGRR